MRLLVCNSHTGQVMATEVNQCESVKEILKKTLITTDNTSDYEVLYNKKPLAPAFSLNWYGIKDGSKLIINKKTKAINQSYYNITEKTPKRIEAMWDEYDREKNRVTDLSYLKTECDTYYVHVFRYLKSYLNELEKIDSVPSYVIKTIIPDSANRISKEPLPELF